MGASPSSTRLRQQNMHQCCDYLYGDMDEGGYGRLKHALNTGLGPGHGRRRWAPLALRQTIRVREIGLHGKWVHKYHLHEKHSHHLNVFDEVDASAVEPHGLASVSHSHAAHPSWSAPGMGVTVEVRLEPLEQSIRSESLTKSPPGVEYLQAWGASRFYGGLPPTSMNLPCDPHSDPNARW